MKDDQVTDLTRGVYRRIFSGFPRGQRISKLSLAAEAWWWRVYVTADDFGNADADPEICYQATVGRRRKVTPAMVEKWLNEMEAADLITFYFVRNEKYLHINGWEDRQVATNRNGRLVRRFPAPPGNLMQKDRASTSSPDQNKDQNQSKDQSQLSRAAQVRALFDFWRTHLNHPKAIMDGKRERCIDNRLKDGYSLEQLKLAVKGCKLTPFNMGDNDQHRVYDDIELICRDAKHVEQFIGRATDDPSLVPPQLRNESDQDKNTREGCQRCFGTGMEITPAGAKRCKHEPLPPTITDVGDFDVVV